MSEDVLNSASKKHFYYQVDDIDAKKDTTDESLKTLMTAVLVRAIEDFRGDGQNRRDAARYLFQAKQDAEDYLFSFQSVCETLQLDISLLRSKILSMQSGLKMRRRVA